jgi:hypothetical protein
MYGGNVEAVEVICINCVSVFVSEGQITESPIVVGLWRI